MTKTISTFSTDKEFERFVDTGGEVDLPAKLAEFEFRRTDNNNHGRRIRLFAFVERITIPDCIAERSRQGRAPGSKLLPNLFRFE